MLIEQQYDTLPSDTSANILTQGLLGEQYVGLSAGGGADYLHDGDEIELTQSALVLEEVVSRFLFSKAEGGEDKGGKQSTESAVEPEHEEHEHEEETAEPAVSPEARAIPGTAPKP
jgi:ABC-type transporter Mla subunit MlaD